ncbi:hypothetical protein [Candidatus Palauibacter sp.]|uniref:hypothetical protein n=1 Tax=Candidatus Palauibacter sp. TaxID=3101350 RepID=UPI003C6F4A39
MNPLVPRTVSLVSPHDDPRFGRDGLSLADFSSDHGYVLLGEPGMGKTEAFEEECRRVEAPDPITAHKFTRGGSDDHVDCRGKPVFIDGLDEMRTGAGDPRTPLHQVVARLEALGNPPFRLSCRTGSWLEPGDQRELSSLTGAGPIRVLRLNPLSREDVRRIVSRRTDDAGEFIFEAFEHGLDPFLWNPQLLSVLLNAVEAAGWPDSPRAAFESACRELSKERNPEHRNARHGRVQPSRDAVLLAAGQLSALLLLTGKEGWTATDTDDPDILSLRDVEGDVNGGEREALLAALDSILFSGAAARQTPVHRLVAEFLGAAYLDRRIRAPHGPGARRVLSLLLGHDGIPLPDLRGLSAWLAALNADARTILIRADPIAVAFGGDAKDFTVGERRELFTQLENSPSLPREWPSAVALGALAGSRDRSPLWELISSPVRKDARQMLVARLLAGFTRRLGATTVGRGPTPTADDDLERRALLRIVYDDTWYDYVRCRAIEALGRLFADRPDRCSALCGILSDIEAGRLPDEDNELLGTLLDHMYPRDIPPTEIWDRLATRPRLPGATSYSSFWDTLLDRSDPEQIRQLLDSLCDRARTVIPALADEGFGNIVLELLARGLELFGDGARDAELYRWFGLVDAAPSRPGLIPAYCNGTVTVGLFSDPSDPIYAWLRSHPSAQLELVVRGVAERESEIGRKALDASVGRKFMGEEVPAGFRQWCLVRAAELADTRPKIAEELAWWAIRVRGGWGPPLPDNEVALAVRNIPTLREWNTERLRAKARWERTDAKRRERTAPILSRVRERRREYVAHVRGHAAGLAEGRCPPALMHELAQAYLEGRAEDAAAEGPIAGLRSRLDGDKALVDATLAGFHRLLDRDDLPDLAEIAQLHQAKRISYFALPFLAGLAEEERAAGDPLELLGEKGLRRALGYYFVSGLHTLRFEAWDRSEREQARRHPGWYRRALGSNPTAVADAMVVVHRARVRAKEGPDRHLHEMGRDAAYARVAPIAVKRMFGVFPSRCTEPQVETLRLVLWAALDPRNMAPAELADLVRKRLGRRGMDVAQRVQWMCAGLFVARANRLPELIDYLAQGSDAHVHHLVDFFVSFDHKLRGALSLDDWEAEELAPLLRALGGRLRRYEPPDGVGMLGDEQLARFRAEPLIRRLIDSLAGRADDEAAAALESLASDPGLKEWTAELSRARDAQAERLRAAKHETPGLAAIQESLRGGRPVSAADLAALVLDAVEQLAARIRDDSTTDWRQYWHLDLKSRRPLRPQHEDDCRNALLSDLQLTLGPYGVDAQKEGQYADDKRADIRVALGSHLAIPIEIKKNLHRDVWRAVDEQLATMYTRAPESRGYGIYLVFWFGPDHMKVVPPSGRLPRTPAELRERLEEQLAPAQQAKISITVIDVSPSGRYAASRLARNHVVRDGVEESPS